MKQYWFGVHCQSEWKAGSPWQMVAPNGEVLDAGEIVAAEPAPLTPAEMRSAEHLARHPFGPSAPPKNTEAAAATFVGCRR